MKTDGQRCRIRSSLHHRPGVQQQSTAARPLFGDAKRASVLLSRAQRPCSTTALVVRDEEAAGSNPVTPTSVSAGERPAREVAKASFPASTATKYRNGVHLRDFPGLRRASRVDRPPCTCTGTPGGAGSHPPPTSTKGADPVVAGSGWCACDCIRLPVVARVGGWMAGCADGKK